MAAIDTIEVLDNLQFQHLDTADIYSVHADGFAGEAVETKAFPIDAKNITAARVIVNNNYGATGSTICAKIRVTGLKAADLAPGSTPSKFEDIQPLEWTSIAINAAALPPTEINLALVKSCNIHLFCAIVGTTAHLGTEFRVQVRNEATVPEWTDLSPGPIVMCSGKTAFKMDVSTSSASGQKVISIANPTAGNLNHINKKIFILDATVANSEVVYQNACGADA